MNRRAIGVVAATVIAVLAFLGWSTLSTPNRDGDASQNNALPQASISTNGGDALTAQTATEDQTASDVSVETDASDPSPEDLQAQTAGPISSGSELPRQGGLDQPLDQSTSASAVSGSTGHTPSPPADDTKTDQTIVAALPTPTQQQVSSGADSAQDTTPSLSGGETDPGAETRLDDGKPRFDVVRVDADGQTVIAGTALPNEEVEVLLDGEVVGSAVADDSGAFVTVIFAALSGDAQKLQLRVPAPTQVQQQSTVVALAPTEPSQPTLPTVGDSTLGSSGLTVNGAPASPQVETPEGDASAGNNPVAPALTDPTRDAASSAEQEQPDDTTATAPFTPSDTQEVSGEQAGGPTEASKQNEESEPDGQAPTMLTGLTELSPVQPGEDAGSPAVSVQTSSGAASTGTQVPAISDAADTAEPTVAAPTAPSIAQPTAVPNIDQQFAVSTPVIILPSGQGGAAPALVQPSADELVVLQPLGEVKAVTLDRISYGQTGDVNMIGRGEAGRALRVYGNGIDLGSSRISGDGRWAITLQRQDVIDVKLFRFDEIDASGAVTSRIETPFSYSSESPQVLEERQVVIEKGDYLWRIAEQYYGEGLRYSLIYGANAELIRDPDLIYPGQVFTVPQLVDAN